MMLKVMEPGDPKIPPTGWHDITADSTPAERSRAAFGFYVRGIDTVIIEMSDIVSTTIQGVRKRAELRRQINPMAQEWRDVINYLSDGDPSNPKKAH